MYLEVKIAILSNSCDIHSYRSLYQKKEKLLRSSKYCRKLTEKIVQIKLFRQKIAQTKNSVYVSGFIWGGG